MLLADVTRRHERDELAAFADAESRIDGPEVIADRVIGDTEARADLLVGQAEGGEISQVALPVRQRGHLDS